MRFHLRDRQSAIGLALAHYALSTTRDVARRLRGDEVVHEGNHVGRVHIERGWLFVLRQADLSKVATRPHDIVRVGRGSNYLGVSGRRAGTVLLTARSLSRTSGQLTGSTGGGPTRAPVAVGPVHVTAPARGVAQVGDALLVRLTHVYQAVLRRSEQVLRGAVHGTRQQPDGVVRARGGRRREDERADERAIARRELRRRVPARQGRRLVQLEQLRVRGRTDVVVLADGILEPLLTQVANVRRRADLEPALAELDVHADHELRRAVHGNRETQLEPRVEPIADVVAVVSVAPVVNV